MRALKRALSHHPGIVLPTDLPRCSASGAVPYRVLAVGGELLAGFGVASHELGLAGALSRELAVATGFGVDIDLEIVPSTSIEHLGGVLARLPLHEVDEVLLVLETADLLPQEATERLTRLLQAVAMRVPHTSGITVALGAPLPHLLTGRRRRWRPAEIGEIEEAVRAAVQLVPGAAFVLLPALPAVAPREAAAGYQEWAAMVAACVAPHLSPPAAGRARHERLDEVRRQDAVEGLRTLDPLWATEFRRIVEFARIAFGTRSAALSLVDGPLTRFVHRRGFDLPEIERGETICDTALRFRGGIVVGDARSDPRFEDRYAVQAGLTAFYAGHRIRSPEGQPVAALCVFDPSPRAVDGTEAITLRDFAIAAERRIWDLLRRTSGGVPLRRPV